MVIMRRIFYGTFYSTILFLANLLPAANWFDSVVDFGIGYRLDQFNWSINEPIFDLKQVELNWKNLQIIDFAASVKITACDLIYWRMNGDWGSIYLGRNRYRAYEPFAGEPLLVSESRSCANGTWVFDGTTGIGFHIGNRSTRLQVSPMVGYSVHGQKLAITDGVEVFGPPLTLGPIHDLHVSYKAIWDGPWLGGDIAIDLCRGFHIIGQAEWHWARYRGHGLWHRRRFCINYRDTASATGYVFVAGINYCTTPTWSFGVMGTLQRFHTNRHWNKHGLSSVDSRLLPEEEFVGALPTLSQTPIRSISWQSMSILFTFDTYF